MNSSIAKYIDGFTPEQEEWVLTKHMISHTFGNLEKRCLVGWAEDVHMGSVESMAIKGEDFSEELVTVALNFDAECKLRGLDVVVEEIRDRIRSNRTKRSTGQAGFTPEQSFHLEGAR